MTAIPHPEDLEFEPAGSPLRAAADRLLAPRFKFHRAADLIAGVKPTAWLLRDVLPDRSMAVVFGEPETAKSFVAVDWACCIAVAQPWCGHACEGPGLAVIIAGEGHDGYSRRLLAWQTVYGDLSNSALLVSATSASLSDPLEAAAVSDAIAEHATQLGQPVRLVVVDTLARNLGADENSNADMSRFVSNLDRHFRERFSCTVLIVHHVGQVDRTRARGASALRGAADAEFHVTREGSMVTLAATKAKDHARPNPRAFQLRVVDLPVADDRGSALTSCVLSPLAAPPASPVITGATDRQRGALDVLRRLHDEHRQRLADGGFDPAGARVLLDDWRQALHAEGLTDRRRWAETLSALIKRNAVRVEAPHVYLG
jgi:KaiC/GvpD/RAD55 family RecA-like ATPase